MKNPLQTFGPNEKGRDFVIGDLHGTIRVFENLCRNLDFDPEKDRMFSVGDLVDRGPESLRTLGLIRKDWFHPVICNHGQMMLERFNGGYMGMFWHQNGGSWGMSTYNTSVMMQQYKNGSIDQPPLISDEDAELFDLLPLVEELPFLITVNHKSGKKFHILHAELPPGSATVTDSDLSSPGRVLELATTQSNDGDSFLWSRFLFNPFYRANLDNRAKLIRTLQAKKAGNWFSDKLSHIISGHTIMQRPVTLMNQTNIDTCSYASTLDDAPAWAGLTCIDLDTWTFYQATETNFKTVEPLVISKDDLV